MNFILITLDSLRKDHVGAYGNDWIRTPHLDQFASESVRFDKAYPESIPTLQFRAAMLTGRRVFPFNRWKPHRSSYPYIERYGLTRDLTLPGWAPIPHEDTTMAELLNDNGYRTFTVTDCLHQHYPGMNYHRGYQSWNFVRGQEWDCWKTDLLNDNRPEISRFFTGKTDMNHPKVWEIERNVMNTAFRESEEDYFAPQVFRIATQWLEANYRCDKLFMTVDSFDPHEPWDPPQYYRDLYYPGYKGKEVIMPIYTNNGSGYLSDDELKYMRACYAAEVTMVDTWFGHFMNKIKLTGLDKKSVIVVVSDHGHQLGEKNYTGKVPQGLLPCLTDIVFMIRHPDGVGAGNAVDSFVYNHDIMPTICKMMDIDIPDWCEGEDIWPIVTGEKDKVRDHATTIFKDFVWARDETYAMISKTDKTLTELFNIKDDPDCLENIAQGNETIIQRLWGYLEQDAGGEIPVIDVSFPMVDVKKEV